MAGRTDTNMSSMWTEANRRSVDLIKSGDPERVELVRRCYDAMRHRETNPELLLHLFTQCRDDAKRLNEPWWVVFFDVARLSTLTSDLHDFARALPLAIDLMVQLNTPGG